MNPVQKRSLLYGTALVVLGGMGYAVATADTDADIITLLSSADAQLRLAYAIPELDKQGEALQARQQMIDDAIDNLQKAEKQTPGMASTAEFRGFAHMLLGEYKDAAACYSRAQQCSDCTDKQGDVLAFNQARMLWKAGNGEGALRVFAQNAASLDSRFGHQRAIEEAEILRHLGRPGDATHRLEAVVKDAAAEPMAWVQAACELLELGYENRAEEVFMVAAEADPFANYYLARLKLRQGQVDRALDCLKCAVTAAPADVMRLVREEPEAWQAVAGDERFVQLTVPVAATPDR